ncbi:SusD/RagB family nutrient-binding outer membrane lipoprotein [Cloacibacterium sp.]|uniref:SusD/RagB family nutrient-binding outer membrane lipoprotein n=1 Tax=Cloacibacterium sp. TaxID=1913682 RepID=UPI0035AE129F
MKKIFLILSTLALVACKLDDNIDPNLPQTKDLSPRNLITAAETTSYAAQTGSMFQLSNIWTNTWSGNYYYYAAPMTREYQMDVTSTFYNGIWNSNYLALANLSQIITSEKSANYPLHVAMSKILFANSMQYIVDFYGDAPYSEAFQQQKKLTPKYDKGEDIYHDLVIKLNEAISTLNSVSMPDVGNEVRATEDVIFGASGNGDTAASSLLYGPWKENWIKLAKTIKLRILLRQSNVSDATIKTFVNQQLSTLIVDPAINPFVSSDVTIQPGYNSGTQAGMNPLYGAYGFYLYDGTRNNSGNRYIMISDHFAKLLRGDASKPTSGVADPRRKAMYRARVRGTAPSEVYGIEQGSVKPSGLLEDNFSRLGWIYNTALATGSANVGYLVTSSESELLQAEAAVLYPQYFSNAQMHYNKAVEKSFTAYGLTGSDASTYLASLDSKSVGWSGAPSKIAAIQYQRLVCLNLTRPVETYINYLKTGYPNTPLAVTATKPNKPYRLVYPQSEYVGNSANVPNVTANDVFVKNNFTPFWNRN